jgi:hypothetical protein
MSPAVSGSSLFSQTLLNVTVSAITTTYSSLELT